MDPVYKKRRSYSVIYKENTTTLVNNINILTINYTSLNNKITYIETVVGTSSGGKPISTYVIEVIDWASKFITYPTEFTGQKVNNKIAL